jgi:hypothetical protein
MNGTLDPRPEALRTCPTRSPRKPTTSRRLLSTLALCALSLGLSSATAAPAKTAEAHERPATRLGERVKRQRWPENRPKQAILKAPKLGSVPFLEGERLQFDIKMLGAKAGECILAVGQRRREGKVGVVEFAAFLRSSEFLSKFYPINDTLKVMVDERTFLPITSTFEISENGSSIEYLTDFQQDRKLLLSDRYKNGRRVSRNHTAADSIYEALSSIYAARRLDLKAGLKFQYYVWDGRRERLVDIEVGKDERIWTPVGWFDTTKVEISTVITGGFVKKDELEGSRKKGYAWFAKDPNRTPVKLSTPTKLGDAEAVLVRRWIETGVDTSTVTVPTTPIATEPPAEAGAPTAPATAPASGL